MADYSGSTRFRARFMSALQAYKQTTGVTLIEHPLTVQLQNCHSVESITTLLKYEARPFSGLLGSDGILTSIESIVSILSTLSSSAPFGEAIGLVRQNALTGCSISLSVFSAIVTYESNPCWPCYPTCCMCRPPVPVSVPFDIQMKQASKRANSCFDTLVDLLESIEHVIKRADIYTRIPPTPAMDEIAFKIIVELFSTLALATKELNQGRSSEFVLADVLP